MKHIYHHQDKLKLMHHYQIKLNGNLTIRLITTITKNISYLLIVTTTSSVMTSGNWISFYLLKPPNQHY